jgi:hypothetical protein
MLNKNIARITALIIGVSVLLSGCAGKSVKIGKYFADGSDSAYIEILANEQILFSDVDFSGIQREADDQDSDFDIAEIMAGSKPFIFKNDILAVKVKDSFGLMIDYNAKENTLVFQDVTYKLR